ncbi:MAG: hypothetical protein ACNA7G_02665 [Methylobacter sp.]
MLTMKVGRLEAWIPAYYSLAVCRLFAGDTDSQTFQVLKTWKV